jgi:hypothetical protein
MPRRKLILASLIGLAVLLAGGVGMFVIRSSDVLLTLLTMEYVPTAEKILAGQHLQPFLVDPSDVEGIYGNIDIDSAVFRYRPGVVDVDEFWRRIDRQIEGTAWTKLPADGELRRFQRVFPKGSKAFCSVEEIRVRYDAVNRRVVVGWVQADSSTDVGRLAACSEADFANHVIWPMVRQD